MGIQVNQFAYPLKGELRGMALNFFFKRISLKIGRLKASLKISYCPGSSLYAPAPVYRVIIVKELNKAGLQRNHYLGMGIEKRP